MLPAAHRLRHSADFATVLRRGRRHGSDVVVVHVLAGSSETTRFGLVVSKAVGNSVVRHRVSRRLRAVLTQRIDAFPAGCDVVVRALPSAAAASSARLGTAMDRAAGRTMDRAAGRVRQSSGAVRP